MHKSSFSAERSGFRVKPQHFKLAHATFSQSTSSQIAYVSMLGYALQNENVYRQKYICVVRKARQMRRRRRLCDGNDRWTAFLTRSDRQKRRRGQRARAECHGHKPVQSAGFVTFQPPICCTLFSIFPQLIFPQILRAYSYGVALYS